ncbi:MAG: IPT/TIG domain-containing protein, partial [Ginsengibacter sp.]
MKNSISYLPYIGRQKKYIFLAINSLFSSVLFAQPTIISFTPTSGPIGTSVTIIGTNFNTTAINNTVYFGAVKATVTAAISTSLTVTVPPEATFQPITVTSNGLTAFSNKPFLVTFSGGGAITTSSFSLAVNVPTTPIAPNPICISDLNNDGKVDIIAGTIGGVVSV